MVFDKVEHKQLVIDLMNQASVPGHFVEEFADFKRTVFEATVKESLNAPKKVTGN